MEITTQQSSAHPPAQPTYVLRGHSAQIHAVHFLRHNTRLITGDADGWVVIWDLPIRRPVAVWRAHTHTVLGLADWDDDKVITHGRDGRLCVWQLRLEDEKTLSSTLPIDDAATERESPWLLHCLTVHALNFCSFAMDHLPTTTNTSCTDTQSDGTIVIAVPGVVDGSIHVTSLPGEERIASIPPPKDTKTGMLMAVGLASAQNDLLVLAGYESGHAAVWRQNPSRTWETIYLQKAHTQPIMSLDVAQDMRAFFTSSADAIIARHSLRNGGEMGTTQTRHAGQQSLSVRDDEKIFATAGWDGRSRVYSCKTLKELAVLKWHKEGCYALAFATTMHDDGGERGGQQSVAKREFSVSARRVAKTKETHWLAIGSKDGKVSLWNIY